MLLSARVLVAALIVAGGAAGPSGTAAAEPLYGPSVSLFTPTPGSHVEVGVPLQISGTSAYSEGSHWDWAEISFDGGETWDYVDKPGPASNWQYFYTPTVEGDLGITTRGHDDGRTGDPRTRVVHVGGPPTASPAWCGIGCRPFVADVYPTVDADPSPVELGLVFQVNRPGVITDVELTRPGNPPTPLRVRLWNSTGDVLADVTDVPTYSFRTSLPMPPNTQVVPGERYVVSYSTEGLPYQSTEWQFSGEVVSDPFRLPVSAGVYSYDGGFPTESWHHSSYSIVPVFTD